MAIEDSNDQPLLTPLLTDNISNSFQDETVEAQKLTDETSSRLVDLTSSTQRNPFYRKFTDTLPKQKKSLTK